MFRNDDSALTWQNPFTPLVPGATQGQLALPPDNEFHQILGTIGYQIDPKMRVSGELAFGRMKQNDAFLAATLNPNLAVPVLPATSLSGSADTLDAALRLSYAVDERLRLAAAVIHNDRDNNTPSLAWPIVSTDMFVTPGTRINLPYSFTRDQAKLSGDWRGPGSWRVAAGADWDSQHRTLQETSRTNEGTVWGRVRVQPDETLGVEAKLAYSDRNNNNYDIVPSVDPPQNPLMRKYNQADRRRNAASVRADLNVAEGVSIGANVEGTDDDYRNSTVGLTGAHSVSGGVDASAAVGENTRLRGYAQGQIIRSSMNGSQSFSTPDWTGRSKDELTTVGIGITQTALMKGKLDVGADLALMRSDARTTILIGSSSTAFPSAKTERQSLTVFATWRQSEKLSILGSVAYEHYDSTDWHLDGLQPGTVPNLLAFGAQAPNYNVTVVRVAARWRY
jgi:MtrB/PioB family decaheme-associated outer membrane protein